MSIPFENLLSVLCSHYEHKHSTEFQKHFHISDEKEAKLVFDVLVSYGFDAKVYKEEEQPGSKLYITLPAADTDLVTAEQQLLTAIAYGKTLKAIKVNLDELCYEHGTLLGSPSYTLTFANMAQNGKQMVISVTPQAQTVTAPATPATQPAQASSAVASTAVRKKKKKKQKEEEDEFSQGPAIGKQLGNAITKSKKQEQNEPDGLGRQIFLYVSGNVATGGAGFIAMAVVVFVLFSFWVLAKGFLCPDFAVEKKDENRAWYCAKPQNEENKKKKPQLPTRGNIR